jgi:hypothetical protein
MDSSWSQEVAVTKFASLFNDYQSLMDQKDKEISQLRERIELLLAIVEKLKNQTVQEVIEEPHIPLTQ